MPSLIRFLIFACIALIFGLGSAWRFIDSGFFATTYEFGPWKVWHKEGTTDADPYTHAHMSRLGILPVTTASSLTFQAKRDNAGSRLSGDCTYEIRGGSFPASWWNIAAFYPDGKPVESKALRASFNSSTIVTAADGRFVVRLSPDIQPGNWLPATRDRNIVLQLQILRPLNPESLLRSGRDILPDILLVECT